MESGTSLFSKFRKGTANLAAAATNNASQRTGAAGGGASGSAAAGAAAASVMEADRDMAGAVFLGCVEVPLQDTLPSATHMRTLTVEDTMWLPLRRRAGNQVRWEKPCYPLPLL